MQLSISKYLQLPFLYLCILSSLCGCTQAQVCSFASCEAYVVWPADEDSQQDVKWATYLFNQLNRRTDSSGVVTLQKVVSKQSIEFITKVDDTQKCDYRIVRKQNQLFLSAKSDYVMLWLIYQLISKVGEEDYRIRVHDLPPAILSCQDVEGSFSFNYRGIYTPSNRDEEFLPIMASNNIDYDWALWGHNLHKVVGAANQEELFAWVDGERNKNQYCFASAELYRKIESHIRNNWGDSETARISIMPNDNKLVCQCTKCVALGNTIESATPAVSTLIIRLARQFPKHSFYTSAYLTTKNPPKQKMPSNVGVIISAIDLPMQLNVESSKLAVPFLGMVEAWKDKVSQLYIWDYIRNFDDYLTPYPMVTIVKSRLLFFEKLGVEGIIFNGSGDDYAIFDDLQTYLLQSLLINPVADSRELCSRYLKRFYPISHSLLQEYYFSLEDSVEKKNSILSYYAGIEEAVKSYLYPNQFEAFYLSLDQLSKVAEGEERSRLNRMLTAMQFTRLELMRIPSQGFDRNKAKVMIELLRGHQAFSEMNNYKERGGAINDYMNQYVAVGVVSDTKNRLTGQSLYLASSNNQKLTLLTDGYYGLPIDYHQGWFITNQARISITIPMQEKPGEYRLKIGMMQAESWNHFIPNRIEVWTGGKNIANFELNAFSRKKGSFRVMAESTVSIKDKTDSIEVRIINSSLPSAKVAIDEIEMY